MIIKKIGKNQYQITAESEYDLINLSLILNKSTIVLFKKYKEKRENQTKKDSKIILKKIILKEINKVEFSNFNSLAVYGQRGPNIIKDNIIVNKPFILIKKLKKNLTKFLSVLDQEKTYYMGVEVNKIIVGYSKNYNFQRLYLKQFSIKKNSLKEVVLEVLNKFKFEINQYKFTFKCSPSIIKELNNWTSKSWSALRRDLRLDWESCFENKKKEQKLIYYFLNNKKKAEVDPQQVLEGLQNEMVQKIFVNPQLNLKYYNEYIKKSPEKIKILPYTKEISNFMPQGVISFNYF